MNGISWSVYVKTQELLRRDREGGAAGGGLAHPVQPPPGYDGGTAERGVLVGMGDKLLQLSI